MQYLSYIYIIVLCSILPLFMRSGYYELGEAKADCYLTVSLSFFAIFIAAMFIQLFRIRRLAAKAQNEGVRVSANRETSAEQPMFFPNFFLCGFLLSSLLSFIFSVDKKMAFFGFEGWRNGFLEALLAAFFLFVYSKYSYDKKWTVFTALAVPAFEFFLGICDRMGLNFFAVEGRSSGYLATIGNINWYAGFLSIFVPIGMGLVYCKKERDIIFYLSCIYTVLGLVALFVQGSDGAILILASSLILLLFIALESRNDIRRLLRVLLLVGLSMTIVDVIMLFAKDFYNYDDNLLLMLCMRHIGIVILAATFFLFCLTRLFDEIKVTFNTKRLRIAFAVVLGILLLAGIAFFISSFDDSFGNGRGIIWRMCYDLFIGLPDWQKMVGVGQDCLYSYVRGNEMWRLSFLNVFGDDILTNAHCELLTVLIERGFIGAVCYLGLFISVLSELIKANKKESTAIVCALPIFSYLIFNQISFAQVMSTPYVFVLMGFGMGLIENSNHGSSGI